MIGQRPVDEVIEVYKRDVDRTLIRYFLKLTAEERLLSLEQSLSDMIEMRQAMQASNQR